MLFKLVVKNKDENEMFCLMFHNFNRRWRGLKQDVRGERKVWLNGEMNIWTNVSRKNRKFKIKFCV